MTQRVAKVPYPRIMGRFLELRCLNGVLLARVDSIHTVQDCKEKFPGGEVIQCAKVMCAQNRDYNTLHTAEQIGEVIEQYYAELMPIDDYEDHLASLTEGERAEFKLGRAV